MVTVERTGEAQRTVANDAGTLALVLRGHPRAIVFQCPCGCGENVLVPVDPAVKGAWRLRVQEERLTLMPSIWRDHGCESHFVLWENEVHWCGARDTESDDDPWPEVLRATLRSWWRRVRRGKERRSEATPRRL